MTKIFRLTFTLFTAVIFSGGVASAAPSVAGVLTSQGQLTVKRKGAAQFVALGGNGLLFEGDVVGTGPNGKATLLFANGSQLRLNSNSTVAVTEPQKAGQKTSFVNVVGGEVWARLRPGQAVKTRSAIAGVRGTVIVLRVAPDDAATLGVIEGEVQFFNAFGDVSVGENQQSTAQPGSAPTKPVTIPNAGLIVEWTLDLDQAAISREKFFTGAPGTRAALLAEVARREKLNDPLALGDALFDAGNFERALTEWQRADMTKPSTLTRIGLANLELGNRDAAQTAFDAALKISPNDAPALTGLAQLKLSQNRSTEAQAIAQRAVAADGKSAEARVALGLALMRQPAKSDEAKAAFDAALIGEPAIYRYQAHAWLALLAVARSDGAAAISAGQNATKLAPQSALAHGNLALAYFYGGNARAAEREANIAAQLNPNSAAARIALGQALLARGDVGKAAELAAQAVALDPQLAPAHYLAGIAAAGQRDYRHAVRDLAESQRLAPDFLPAAAALARVYTRMGRKSEAVAVLTNVQKRQPSNRDVLAALGEVYYEQANYEKALEVFQQAVKQSPSALAHAGLAKVALDANRLELAISAGQKAVQLAPNISQYHAILGQIYGFARLDTQSDRELRTALSLDPQNAFALAQTSLKFVDGDARTTARSRGVGTRQAFMLDPAVSDQLLRGGIDSEVRARGGSRDWNQTLVHRDRQMDGKLHFLGSVQRLEDEGNRLNSDRSVIDAFQELTYSVSPATNVYLNLIHLEANNGLPGFETKPVFDDREEFRLNQGIIGARHRVGRQSYLWAGFLDTVQRDQRINPGRDSSFRATPVISLINVPQSVSRVAATSREVRLDVPSSLRRDDSGLFSFGAARLRSRQQVTTLFSNAIGRADLGILAQPASADTDLAYVQLAQNVGKRLSVTGQLRYQTQTFARDSIFTSLSPSLPVFALAPERSESSDLLPSLVANYQLNPKTQLRLIANKRSTDVVSSIFTPVDSTNFSESATLPLGLPTNLRAVEFDAERHLNSSTFLKAFVFRTTADATSYSLTGFSNPSSSNNVLSSLVMTGVKRSGAGVRLEKRLSRGLFGQLAWTSSRTTGDTSGVAGVGLPLPYHPDSQIGFGLNYVSSAGTKASLQINRSGSFFQDAGNGLPGPRPTFPARTYVDLTLAKEPTVKTELFLKVSNLFNQPQIIFNDVPAGERRVLFGVNKRF